MGNKNPKQNEIFSNPTQGSYYPYHERNFPQEQNLSRKQEIFRKNLNLLLFFVLKYLAMNFREELAFFSFSAWRWTWTTWKQGSAVRCLSLKGKVGCLCFVWDVRAGCVAKKALQKLHLNFKASRFCLSRASCFTWPRPNICPYFPFKGFFCDIFRRTLDL